MKRILSNIAIALISSALHAQPDLEKQIQTQLILAEDGATIELPAAKIALAGTLSLDAKKRITIRGAGQDKTVLSFKNQKQGAEGLKITNAENIVLQDFTIEDSKGDLIKTQQVRGILFRNITARWTGKPSKNNGSYALYPVQCSQVTIENCTAIGASDAGIYVGQSDSVWVRNCTARHNVAGIEIENTTHAWVSDNTATENTGGILVFDLPDLPKSAGGQVQVFRNRIFKNNHRNFAPKGNIVGTVPPGTGVMILATRGVEVFENQILDNRTASCAIISYELLDIPIKDKRYNPYPAAIAVHDNKFSSGKRWPTLRSPFGKLFLLKFGRRTPHILWDGIQDPTQIGTDGTLKPAFKICVRDNENGTFANLRAEHKFKKINRDLAPHNCTLAAGGGQNEPEEPSVKKRNP